MNKRFRKRAMKLLMIFGLIIMFMSPMLETPPNSWESDGTELVDIEKPNKSYSSADEVNPVLAADSDDDYWRYNDTDSSWQHYTGQGTVRSSCNWSGEWFSGSQRFSLAIPQGSIIISANITNYELQDITSMTFSIYRINETNVGSLEADSSFPSIDYSEYHDYDFDGVAYEWHTESVTDLVQTQVNLDDWNSGNYFGINYNITTFGAQNYLFEDYQNTYSNHSYMNITYTSPLSFNVELAADSDDDCWESPYPEAGSPEHDTTAIYEYVAYYDFLNQSALQWRFQLDLPQESTIVFANLSLYILYSGEAAAHTMYLRRINETNVGSLEGDSVMPVTNDTNMVTVENPALGNGYWLNITVTDLVQDQVNLGDWVSNQYIGFRLNNSAYNEDSYLGVEDFQHSNTNHPYMNVTYTGQQSPQNAATPSCSNLDDTDNLYSGTKQYQVTVNATDPDGFDAIDYVELSLWTDSRGVELWRVRFDEDTATFSEQYDPNNIMTLNTTGSTNSSSGNNVSTQYLLSYQRNTFKIRSGKLNRL